MWSSFSRSWLFFDCLARFCYICTHMGRLKPRAQNMCLYVYMDARPRQLLIDFLSTEIGCKLRKLRPTQIRRLLDEFCNPPTALPHSPANSPRNCVLVPVSGLFCRILYVKNKHLVTVSSSQAPRSWLLITFCAIWELSLRRVAYCFQGFCSRARKNLYINLRILDLQPELWVQQVV